MAASNAPLEALHLYFGLHTLNLEIGDVGYGSPLMLKIHQHTN
jgi:hypothetical protein